MPSTLAVVLLLSLALPVFSTTPPSSISVSSIRESLRVNCSAKGSPLPTVTWYKNDVSMHVINNITEDEVTSELVFGEFQPADQATYRCVARNVYNDTVETSSRICKSTLHTLIDCQQSVLVITITIIVYLIDHFSRRMGLFRAGQCETNIVNSDTNIVNKHNMVKILTDRRQTSWLFTKPMS